MANKIKMRVRKDNKGICKCCGGTDKNTIDLFDLCLGDEVITICDECNELLFNKTLKATVYVNSRVKSDKDLAIKASRRSKLFKSDDRSLNDCLKD